MVLAISAAPNCTSVCPSIYKPICAGPIAGGSGGEEQTFTNDCQLAYYNCYYQTSNVSHFVANIKIK